MKNIHLFLLKKTMRTTNDIITLPGISQNKNSSMNIINKIIGNIKDIFTKPIEEDKSFTDLKIIKKNKLQKEINDALVFIQSISNFLKNNKDWNTISKIKFLRIESQRNKNRLNQSLESIENKYPEYNWFHNIINETEKIIDKLDNLEQIFQSLWMEYKTDFKAPTFETVSDLYENLNKDFYYTTKGSQKQQKAKIKHIDIEWNDIILQIETEDINDKKRKSKFATSFKKNPNELFPSEINNHFSKSLHKSTKNKWEIDRNKLQYEIERIIQNEEPKIIDLPTVNKHQKAL